MLDTLRRVAKQSGGWGWGFEVQGWVLNDMSGGVGASQFPKNFYVTSVVNGKKDNKEL